ncbi:MAG TPA: GNAT family N-acetyltransferase [Blastocatellia bacterium]|nr:GNAT family N-acetyltransferase [Blastocatellia bacterium]
MQTIRKATLEDCSAILRTHASAVRAIPAGLYTIEEIEAWAVPREIESYRQAIQDKEFYVADSGGVVGFGVLNRYAQLIEALYVTAEAKGQGIGARLLLRLEERGRELGMEAVGLNASLNAVGFYKKAGYVAQEGTTYRLATGLEIRCVPMSKALK